MWQFAAVILFYSQREVHLLRKMGGQKWEIFVVGLPLVKPQEFLFEKKYFLLFKNKLSYMSGI